MKPSILSEDQKELLLELAHMAAPDEACGIVIDGRVVEKYNHALELSSFEMMITEEEYEACSALWHTHPHGRTTPSVSDLRAHPWEDGKWMIIATLTEVYFYGPETGQTPAHRISPCTEILGA